MSVFRVLSIIGLILLLLSGCTEKNEAPDNPVSPDSPDNSVEQEPDEQQSPLQTLPGQPNDEDQFTLIFTDDILSEPQKYMKQLIPGFKIGLGKNKIEEFLGEPDNIETIEYDWGKNTDWIYKQIKGYKFIVTFNYADQVQNFKLIKNLAGKGSIPNYIGKTQPDDGTKVKYTELGFEGVLLGNMIKDILNRYGEPLSGYMSYDEMYGYNLAMVYKGLTLHIRLETQTPYLQLIETNDMGIISSYRGISVGSSVEDVISKYGEPSYTWEESGDLIYPTEDFWFAIKFIIENEKVVSISIYEAS